MLNAEKSLYEDIKGFAKKWWVFLILGIISIGLSIYMICNQGVGYILLSVVFAAFYLINGIIRLIFVIRNRKSIPAWGWSLVGAILMVIVGGMLCFRPMLSEAVVLMLFNIGIIFFGINTIFSVGLLEGFGWKLLAVLFGLLTMAAGFMMIWNPLVGILTVDFITAIGLMSSGIGNLVAAYRLSVLKSQLQYIE